jgi:iron-sulfur cluster assembly protein
MAITLTESAARRVRKHLDARGEGARLRLGVTKTGCSGYSYVINYAEESSAADIEFEDKGVRVLVDSEALQLIDGTEVDFVKNGLNEAFSFRNPNIKGECGCGESFNV